MAVRDAFSQHAPDEGAHPKSGPSLTQQHMSDETDINNIVNQFLKTGMVNSPGMAKFGDFTANDFQTMQNHVCDMEGMFMELDAKIRRRFKNDVYQLLRFIDNPDNKEEAISLGLIPDDNPKTNPSQAGKSATTSSVTPAEESSPLPLKADPEAQPRY